MKFLFLFLALALVSCAAPVSVTPKPNIVPVATSNKQIRESSAKIKKSGEQSLKLNQDLQGNLNSATQELDNILK